MADLSAFATKDNADEGKLFPVKINGTKFPMAIKIFGSDSDIVKDYENKRLRKIGIGAVTGKNIDDETLEELMESADEGVIVRIGGVYTYDWKKKITIDEPLTLGEKTITNDKKSYAFLLEKIPALKEFINEKSNERSNFLD